MSEENVAIVRRGIEAFSANDFDGWFAVSSPQVKVYPRVEEPGVRACYEGWDELLEYVVNWYSGWDDYTGEPVRFIDAGEWVVVEMREVGIVKSNGMRVEENFAHALKLADGKIVEWRMFGPVSEALEALGLDEQVA